MTGPDRKADRILGAIKCQRRPYDEAAIAQATGYSKSTVRDRCRKLEEDGLIEAYWLGTSGPFWQVIDRGIISLA